MAQENANPARATPGSLEGCSKQIGQTSDNKPADKAQEPTPEQRAILRDWNRDLRKRMARIILLRETVGVGHETVARLEGEANAYLRVEAFLEGGDR